MPRTARGKSVSGVDKPWRDAIRIAVNEKTESGARKLRLIAETTVQRAIDGDMQAVAEIGNRLDGKAHQTTDTNLTMSVGEAFIDMLRWVADERRAQMGTVAGGLVIEQAPTTTVRNGRAGSDQH